MTYIQRDLVWLKHNPPLPDGTDLDHPVIIISNRSSNSKENFYTGVMTTGSLHTDLFTFRLVDSMFESPLNKKNCQARLYILTSFRDDQVRKWANRMNKENFQSLIRDLKDYVLSVD